jgi:sporulation protein YlmC with PRC-barrel domain
MISKSIAAVALVSAALITTAASAQTSQTSPNTATTTATSHRDEWRASKVIGINVYNDANEKIGDINELLLDRSGKVVNVIIGVGGFLGVGEHNVAIAYDNIKWVDHPVTSASTTSTTKTTTTKTTTGTATTTPSSSINNWYPDHAVVNATKEQLKAMAQFKY